MVVTLDTLIGSIVINVSLASFKFNCRLEIGDVAPETKTEYESRESLSKVTRPVAMVCSSPFGSKKSASPSPLETSTVPLT